MFSILMQNSFKFVHEDPINNKLTMVQVMAYRRTGDKPLLKPILIELYVITGCNWARMS